MGARIILIERANKYNEAAKYFRGPTASAQQGVAQPPTRPVGILPLAAGFDIKRFNRRSFQPERTFFVELAARGSLMGKCLQLASTDALRCRPLLLFVAFEYQDGELFYPSVLSKS